MDHDQLGLILEIVTELCLKYYHKTIAKNIQPKTFFSDCERLNQECF